MKVRAFHQPFITGQRDPADEPRNDEARLRISAKPGFID
jgi:hypothetical protein